MLDMDLRPGLVYQFIVVRSAGPLEPNEQMSLEHIGGSHRFRTHNLPISSRETKVVYNGRPEDGIVRSQRRRGRAVNPIAS
jgi:hypothetical protein